MPTNDTENIYATQYGGEGEPIPATKISYDNTTSGLTADDIQEAVDEVALEAKGASQGVTSLETYLGDNYVIESIGESIKGIDKVTNKELLPKYPEVDWKGAMGIRDIIAHHYFDIDAEEIYNIIKFDLKPLLQSIDNFIDKLHNIQSIL